MSNRSSSHILCISCHLRLKLEAITFFLHFMPWHFFAFKHFKINAGVPVGTSIGRMSWSLSWLCLNLPLLSSVGWSWIRSLGSVEVKLLVVQLRQVRGATVGSCNCQLLRSRGWIFFVPTWEAGRQFGGLWIRVSSSSSSSRVWGRMTQVRRGRSSCCVVLMRRVRVRRETSRNPRSGTAGADPLV